jgi:hypothetical protein
MDQEPVPTTNQPIEPAVSQPVTSPEPLSNVPQPHNLKPFWVFVAVAFLAIVGVGGVLIGKYLYAPKPVSNQIPTPTVIPTPTPDPTADWKLYTNSKYGFEIKYPSLLDKREISIFEKSENTIYLGNSETEPMITISIFSNPGIKELDSFWWQNNFNLIFGKPIKDETSLTDQDFILENIIINNIKVFRAMPKPTVCDNVSLRYIMDHYFITAEKYVIHLNFEHNSPLSGCFYTGQQIDNNLKQQILSTFKFI